METIFSSRSCGLRMSSISWDRKSKPPLSVTPKNPAIQNPISAPSSIGGSPICSHKGAQLAAMEACQEVTCALALSAREFNSASASSPSTASSESHSTLAVEYPSLSPLSSTRNTLVPMQSACDLPSVVNAHSVILRSVPTSSNEPSCVGAHIPNVCVVSMHLRSISRYLGSKMCRGHLTLGRAVLQTKIGIQLDCASAAAASCSSICCLLSAMTCGASTLSARERESSLAQ
mmetsp:Transcript_7110/g.17689  ORF Transcript_7110/g.17689 Transcript_7110/m.17689 type:complete len:232 (-) Transcript_7110:226-921(-)|eukprot:CAMPEP_0206269366 /NCGR_PEP_ID=MMETSP0047_2-20121206/32244_1 /ASSEMBLY_ACC=CAM_ASM_000192 /TAXON_ID=195065 /ORGANISM="Chroomonas mesostigmatica_cf, Strain CCMP1168" /LENGTH=231 /DNA_ID=CAMNT_0053697831 /DNA_START=229 /DNA_END=924 /DNA_ORIENTATION=-